MTASTGETTGQVEQTPRRGIPADTYAHRLMLARAHAGNLSIREAAERAGLNYASWANWEQGTRSRTLVEDVQAISEALGVDRDWLMYGGPLTRVPPTQRDRHGRRRRDSTNRVYASLPDQGKPFGQVRPPTWSSRSGRAPRDVRPLPRPVSPAWAKTVRRAA